MADNSLAMDSYIYSQRPLVVGGMFGEIGGYTIAVINYDNQPAVEWIQWS